MKVLIACEESQEVCKAFRRRGHEAYSCDIQEPSGGHPEWHILGDAVTALRGGSVCFMWATFPQIADALRVMEAWGFEYKTCAFVWIKKNRKSNTNFWGMGAYTRANAEICLLGVTPGFKPAAQIKNHAVHQVIESPVEEHSKKPEETRRRIVKLLGDVPRIELFARQRSPGWDAWGNEIGEQDEK